MSTPVTREPLTIVELEQPRCALRHGVAPCTATGRECFQTYWTCGDRENYDPTGSIRWRFAMPEAGVLPLYERDGEHIATNPIYCLRSVSTTSSRINLGAMRTGESPFGVRGSVTVNLTDVQWDDHVGDFYRLDRPEPVRAGFWALWKARNRDPFRGKLMLRVYEGFRGQALSEMQLRAYVVRDVTGPDASGAVTIRGDDPLQLADRQRAMFPRATDIRLVGDVAAGAGPVRVLCGQCAPGAGALSADFGNTGSQRYLRIGREILGYTGWTDEGAGEYLLTGVTRGTLGTQTAAHQRGDGCQRVGRYENITMAAVVEDLLKHHTEIPNQYINAGGQWGQERPWLRARTSATIPDPEPVETLIGELCRDGGFVIWWDERQQTIPILTLRPPQEAPRLLTDGLNILAGSAQLREAPDDRLTRVAVFYGQVDPTERLDAQANYRVRRIRVDGEVEGPAADGTIRERQIFSRWIRTDTNAFLVAAAQLQRYRITPEYLTAGLAAKDRDLAIGAVVDVETRAILDSLGEPERRRWQVIRAEEVDHGHKVQIEAQAFALEGKRFAVILPNDAPDYASATEEQRAFGCWLADETTGLMPNGDDPYLLQ